MASANANRGAIVVTGASRGIGEAIAHRLARRDREIVLLARTKEAMQQIASDIRSEGGRATWIVADLSTAASARKAAAKIRAKVDSVHTLVLNAGMSNNQLFERTNMEALEYELGVNYIAPVALMEALLPDMIRRRRGRVVAVGSLTAMIPFPGNASYAASKSAMLTLMRSLAIELRPRGIRVSVVLPGFTQTAAVEALGGRLPALSPEEVAEAVANATRTGASIVIPGMENKVAAALFRSLPQTLDRAVGLVGRWIVPGYSRALHEGSH